MEAVNNAANAAARAVWGDSAHGEEPMSGAQGNVPRGEPYDAGNLSAEAQRARLDSTPNDTTSTQQTSMHHDATHDDDASAPNYSHVSGPMSSGGAGEGHLDRSGDTSHELDSVPATNAGFNPSASTADREPDVVGEESSTVINDRHGEERTVDHSSRSVDPAASARPAAIASLDQVSHGGEQALSTAKNDRVTSDKIVDVDEKETAVGYGDGPPDAPSSDKPTEYAVKESSKKESTSEAEDVNPETSVMGDGPKSLEVVAKENGGDAGNSGDASKRDANKSSSETTDEGGEEASEESKGTGEEYVRTTGFAADGGDFDATKPGAGREADRLMEEKGMSREGGGNKGGVGGGDGEKPSLGERIKNKLHKH